MDSHVVAVDVFGWFFIHRRFQTQTYPLLQFVLETLGSPSMLQEEKLQPRPFAVLPQLVAVAENLGNSFEHGNRLVPAHEGIQAHGEVRISGESSTHPQGETDLGILACAANCGETNIIDLGIGAPDPAARNTDLELARQVVEIRVADEEAV